jgi:hypothetical protein
MTVRFKNELVRNITIKLGYANAKIYKCENEACPRPGNYRSYRSDKEDNPPCERPGCGHRMKLIRHVSFVDCPGHDILMATMLNGAAVMDAALLLIAANETCPQPQTSEHLAAVEIMKLEHLIILQNKVDLIKEAQALEHQKSISAFVKGTVAESSPIVPISAQLKYNIDAVNEYIVKCIPIPLRDFTSDPRLIVIRSFDVNQSRSFERRIELPLVYHLSNAHVRRPHDRLVADASLEMSKSQVNRIRSKRTRVHVRRSSDDDHYHVKAVHVRHCCPLLMHFRRADSFRHQQPPSPSHASKSIETWLRIT